MDCCASLLDRLACTGANRQSQKELKMFDTEPLVKPKPNRHSMTLTSEQITDLLFKFLLYEYHRTKLHERKTHYLGSELVDRFFCLFCDNDKHTTYIQYEISNGFFENVWKGNQYIVQYACIPCAKRLQKQLRNTIAQFHQHVQSNQSRLVLQILMRHNVPIALQQTIRSFLPQQFVSMKCITHHFANNINKQSDAWIEEQMIR